MSFPIFYPHRPLTLGEVYRYLKFFPFHTVYLNAHQGLATEKSIPVETTHTFATHGLTFTLHWQGNVPERIRSCHIPSKDLFKRHRQGELSLLRYELTQYSKPNSMQEGVPTEEARAIFYDIILEDTYSPVLTEEQYHQLEYSCNELNSISPTLYEQFIEEQNRKIEFDTYYQEYKKRKHDISDNNDSAYDKDKKTYL